MYKVAWVGQEEVEKCLKKSLGPSFDIHRWAWAWSGERGGVGEEKGLDRCVLKEEERLKRGGKRWWGKREEGMGGKYPKVMKQEWDGETERGGVERMRKRTKLQCGSFLTCPTHWISRGGGENLWGKVFKGHDLSMVLNNGLQVECPLLIAGKVLLREST